MAKSTQFWHFIAAFMARNNKTKFSSLTLTWKRNPLNYNLEYCKGIMTFLVQILIYVFIFCTKFRFKSIPFCLWTDFAKYKSTTKQDKYYFQQEWLDRLRILPGPRICIFFFRMMDIWTYYTLNNKHNIIFWSWV